MAQYLDMPRESADCFRRWILKKVPNGKQQAKWDELLSIYRGFIEEIPDIGGKKNVMWKNLYGAVACFAWYEAFDPHPSDEEMKQILRENMIPDKEKQTFAKIDFDNPIVQKVFYAVIQSVANKLNRKKASGEWGNTWGIVVNPLHHQEGISMHLVGCPIADFAKSHGYEHLMPIFCGSDYESIRCNFGKKLQREHTIAQGYEDCDYWILNKK